jgi:hypothetical protein
MPRVARVAPKKVLDATEQKIGQDSVITMEPTGPAAVDIPVVEAVDGPDAMKQIEELAFMEELVDVTVLDTEDKYASKVVTIGVNGRNQNFVRGQSVTVKRKYLEGLARAKPVSLRNEEFLNNDGDKQFRYPTSTGLRYGFTLDRDDNPRGREWLKKVLKEA